jgi:ubiquinone/menaquinone biosynthesis C-methylase UbiE
MEDYRGILKQKFSRILAEFLPDLSDLPQTSNRLALDLGTGAGFFAFILSELGWPVAGVDYSEAMLQTARKNAADLGLSNKNIRFTRMDVQSLDFPGCSFDAIVSRNVTWTLSDPRAAYAEMVRVLKPGGRILNFDANYARAFKRQEQRGEQPKHLTQSLAQLLERNEIAKALYISEKNRPFWDIETLADLGISRFTVDLDIDRCLCEGTSKDAVYAGVSQVDREPLFLIVAQKDDL